LSKVAEAETAAARGEHTRVIQLLGSWPAPLAIFLRTPEGQMLSPEARALIAKGLGLLGTACVKLGEQHQGEEVMRLAVQYAQDGAAAADIFRRLGEAQLEHNRAGEAIGCLRRAAKLGSPPKLVWPLLARAFIQRKRFVAAFACIREARSAGVTEAEMIAEIGEVEAVLGPALTAWRALVATARSN
jgi:Flp pilus assembly protein TadD